MSKGKKYKIPHKYLSKYPIRKSIKRDRYRIIGGKMVKKQSLSTLDTKTLEDPRRSYIYEEDGG